MDKDPGDLLTPGTSTDVPHLPNPILPGNPDYVAPDPLAVPVGEE